MIFTLCFISLNFSQIIRLNTSCIESLIKGFYHLGNLRHLDLSYNATLTTSDIDRVLQDLWTNNIFLAELNLHGSPNTFSDGSNVLAKYLESSCKLDKLTFSCKDESLAQDLADVWRSAWGQSSKTSLSNNIWTFSRF